MENVIFFPTKVAGRFFLRPPLNPSRSAEQFVSLSFSAQHTLSFTLLSFSLSLSLVLLCLLLRKARICFI